ncbi:MAG: homocysteine S-methyltransferase family protein [Myxococcota bacterium]
MSWSLLAQRLEKGRIVLMDGAMGTELAARGARFEGHPLWASSVLASSEGRQLTTEVHRRYLAAGAELLVANTHNASAAACRQAGADLVAINEAAVIALRAACEDATEPVWLAGCTMSPDRPYATTASLSVEATAEAYRPQVELLDQLGLDLMIFEMLSTEADVKGGAAVAHASRTPVAAGFTCGRDGRTRGGVSLVEAAAAWSMAEVLFIQCTPWPEVGPALAALPATRVRGAYGNGGRRWTGSRFEGEAADPDIYAEAAEGWLTQGIRVVGGCCDTGPRHVAGLARMLDRI